MLRHRFRILFRILAMQVLALAGGAQPYNGDLHVFGRRATVPPKLVFASDSSTIQLASLLAQPHITTDLEELKAGIALSLPDLDTQRAKIVAQLNKAGIPVIAWLTLPGQQGYYLNAGNAPQAAARFEEFERWTAEHKLRWAAIGLDFEPRIQDFSAVRNSKLYLAATLARRYFEFGRVRRARESYAGLIKKMQTHGYSVETYQFPFIADERRMHSTLLERLTGIVDIRGNTEVFMLYTSFNPKLDSALIWAYGGEAQAIAVGSTAGSASDGQFVPLDWKEFSRDLIVAGHFSDLIGIYSLEGCIRKDLLSRLVTMDWNREVVIPAGSIQEAAQFRSRVQRAIWIVSRLPYFAFMIMIAGAGGVFWRRARRIRATQVERHS